MATYDVRRSITIDAAPEAIYQQVVDLRNWEAWSPWEGLDPSLEKTYSGPESGPGSSYHWKGNRKVGEGSMTITDAEANRKVTIDLRFIKPFKSQSETVLTLEPVDGGTRVEWSMTGSHTAMSQVFSLVRPMDKMVGPDFEKGLSRLKAVVES